MPHNNEVWNDSGQPVGGTDDNIHFRMFKTKPDGTLVTDATFSGPINGNPAAGPTGAPVPADADFVGFQDGSGNLEGVSATTPLPVGTATSSTATTVLLTVTAASSLALTANAGRKELMVVNTGTTPVLLRLGAAPTATLYSVALSPCTTANDGTGGVYVSDIWLGDVDAIVASGTGTVVVTELT